VSPLWRDEIGIFLGPTKVVLARMKKGLRPKCVAEQGVSVETAHCGDWQPAVDEMRRQLRNDLWHSANVRFVVSDHWARYAVLPWSADLTRLAERETHARLILKNTYGDVADDWAISIGESPPRTASVVSAIPIRLISELQDLVAVFKLRLTSIQPHLIVAYNGWRARLPEAAAWFASIDEGSLAALHLTDGRCDRIRSVRLSDDWTVEMRRMQTIGRLAQGRPAEGKVFVDAPTWLRAAARTGTGTEALEWLEDKRPVQNIADKVSLLKAMYT
jgi:hypothetical protein